VWLTLDFDAKELQVETILYLLFAAAFFIVMMRFGCGAHIMGHNQHMNHDADDRREGNGPNRAAAPLPIHEYRSASPDYDSALQTGDHSHG
jgi:hypothetical protein